MKFFWLRGPCYESDPNLPPIGPAAVVHPVKKRLVCEHCECQLTPEGDVLRMSDRARAHLRHDETIAAKDKEIETLKTDLRDARAKLAEYATVRESAKGAGLEF